MMQEEITEQVKEQVKEVIPKNIWDTLQEFFSYEIFHFGTDEHPFVLTVGLLFFVLLVFVITSVILKLTKRVFTRKMQSQDKLKFESVFSFSKYFIYLIVIFFALDSIGFNITAIFAASAALLVGVGLALQTFIQDILSGIFIFIDQTVHVGDIIELDGKVGRVEEIKLRTTRAVTIDNKVLIIPNHKYMSSSLYNWTQNGTVTRESVSVGVAYGSDTQLVKELLIKAASSNSNVLKDPPPMVLFTDFADSSLNFKIIFTIDDSFQSGVPKSEIRFEIDRLFREHNINIPFPQREVTIIKE
ncbi:small-conductance mechanosensitive channel [Aquimarina sp. EL_43]|uniref:mechanosensitive ion channel family protein n=1 Tax=Aquimarina TaxID=290174 RepID=UPI0004B16B69|nr:small-conductance mechanosensitive channel [Aquimarina sp. EL_35]MBG6152598.1 small-conductance mechanosensitive channel [Aquimarina sp. EL_32]MBG6170475.1 small-conductance mechanosensitive channel [Aquimarina sp. EL_43]